MEIKHGLISCDSHAQPHKDTWVNRMSKAKWGDAIPHIAETANKAHMAVPVDGVVDRWFVNGQLVQPKGACSCPAAGGTEGQYWPQRWEEVPSYVYDPKDRLWAMDNDGIDAEVVFPNDPFVPAVCFQGDAEFELDCVRAYNDCIAEWRQVSDRYVPLAMIPYLSGIEVTVAEATRAVETGHRGIIMLAEPSHTKDGLQHFNDSYWDPLWAACQEMDAPIHWHSNAGIRLSIPAWKGYTRLQDEAMRPAAHFSTPAQFIPNLIFSGVLERFPTLKWVCAETGLGWLSYVLEACDHEWDRRHLWTEGVPIRPSELFRRQIYVDFWYEKAGIHQRHHIGMDHIMWESDFPHATSTYPESWKFVERSLEGVPKDERDQLLYTNAITLYKL